MLISPLFSDSGDDNAPISLHQAMRFFPGDSAGTTVTYHTVLRWVHQGVKGVKLESQLMGGRIRTTKAAVLRFLAKLNGDRAPIIPTVALNDDAIDRALALEFGLKV